MELLSILSNNVFIGFIGIIIGWSLNQISEEIKLKRKKDGVKSLLNVEMENIMKNLHKYYDSYGLNRNFDLDNLFEENSPRLNMKLSDYEKNNILSNNLSEDEKRIIKNILLSLAHFEDINLVKWDKLIEFIPVTFDKNEISFYNNFTEKLLELNYKVEFYGNQFGFPKEKYLDKNLGWSIKQSKFTPEQIAKYLLIENSLTPWKDIKDSIENIFEDEDKIMDILS